MPVATRFQPDTLKERLVGALDEVDRRARTNTSWRLTDDRVVWTDGPSTELVTWVLADCDLPVWRSATAPGFRLQRTVSLVAWCHLLDGRTVSDAARLAPTWTCRGHAEWVASPRAIAAAAVVLAKETAPEGWTLLPERLTAEAVASCISRHRVWQLVDDD